MHQPVQSICFLEGKKKEREREIKKNNLEKQGGT